MNPTGFPRGCCLQLRCSILCCILKFANSIFVQMPVVEQLFGSLSLGTEVHEHPLAFNSEPDEFVMESGTDPCNNSPPASRDAVPPSDLLVDQPVNDSKASKPILETNSVMLTLRGSGQNAPGGHLSEFETGEAFGRWVEVSDHHDWAPVEVRSQLNKT